jgi:predicted ATPase
LGHIPRSGLIKIWPVQVPLARIIREGAESGVWGGEIGSTVILEQPEIHLHPAVQADLADVLIDAYRKRGVQIIVESHSEHLLRRLQRRIAEKKLSRDEVGLYFCQIGAAGSSLTTLDVDLFGNISNWPSDFFGDQFGEIKAISDATLQRKKADGT